jgi:Tfp pilus assembly protein PilO
VPILNMDKATLDEIFGKKNVKDYTFTIIFLVLSSFFAFFVIKPVLSVAVGLQKEAADLQEINRVYEQNVRQVIEIQKKLELISEEKYLLDEAITDQPNMSDIIISIKKAAAESGIEIISFNLSGITYADRSTPASQDPKNIKVQVSVRGNYPGVVAFLNTLLNQRRLKTINSVKMIQQKSEKNNIPVINLNMDLNIDTSYFSKAEVK